MSEFSVIGRRLPKVNSWAHLTGEARYADDLFLPRMLYGAFSGRRALTPASAAWTLAARSRTPASWRS